MIISVASGKGGTGKTTIATNLAVALEQPVCFLDCDVEEPNAHLFLKPAFYRSQDFHLEVPEIDPARCTFCGKCREICRFNAIAVLPAAALTFPELPQELSFPGISALYARVSPRLRLKARPFWSIIIMSK